MLLSDHEIEAYRRDIVLEAGQISLHDVYLVHELKLSVLSALVNWRCIRSAGSVAAGTAAPCC